MPSLKSFLLAIAAIAPVAFSSPLPQEEPRNATLTARAGPQWISGPWWNFPSISTWRSFDDLVRISFLEIVSTIIPRIKN